MPIILLRNCFFNGRRYLLALLSMNFKALLYLIPFILCLASCQAITDDMFPGKYAMNTDKLKDSLILNENYTYRHTYTDSTNKTYISTGKWELNFNKTVMLLHNFNSFNAHGIKFRGTWKSFMSMDNDSVRIIYSSDEENELHYGKKIDADDDN
jgi:hypothetical protein